MTKGDRLVWNRETQAFEPGRASPELLREDLRALPGDLVTKDIADSEKVHAFDPPHVSETILDDAAAKATPEKQELPEALATAVARLTVDAGPALSQVKIDIIKMRIIGAVITSSVELWSRGSQPDLAVRHLWFPQDTVEIYEMRPGNAPAPSERPRHLRRYDLSIDVFNWPRSVMDALQAMGYDISYKDMREWKKNYESLGNSLFQEQRLTMVDDSLPLSFLAPTLRH